MRQVRVRWRTIPLAYGLEDESQSPYILDTASTQCWLQTHRPRAFRAQVAAWSIPLRQRDAKVYVRAITRSLGLDEPRINFVRTPLDRQEGRVWFKDGSGDLDGARDRIVFDHCPTLGLVLHEAAHLVSREKDHGPEFSVALADIVESIAF